mmetsp:Transcript_14653/g.37077  ORF Transcript_14653/g.37077 Transcript_14653/m.37077 type:complete len:239 (-) Transcript_14653:488-1204(-)
MYVSLPSASGCSQVRSATPLRHLVTAPTTARGHLQRRSSHAPDSCWRWANMRSKYAARASRSWPALPGPAALLPALDAGPELPSLWPPAGILLRGAAAASSRGAPPASCDGPLPYMASRNLTSFSSRCWRVISASLAFLLLAAAVRFGLASALASFCLGAFFLLWSCCCWCRGCCSSTSGRCSLAVAPGALAAALAPLAALLLARFLAGSRGELRRTSSRRRSTSPSFLVCFSPGAAA